MNITIITNNRPRMLVCAAELPAKVRDDFDYIEWGEGYEPRFVQYKGTWYDVCDTDGKDGGRIPSAFKGWDEWRSESFWSGVLFRFTDDGVVVGRYYC